MRLSSIYRYPVKGLGPEVLSRVEIDAHGLRGDRAWAVMHGGSKFDPENPEWVSCRNFLIISQNPALAAVRLSRAGPGPCFTVSREGDAPLKVDLATGEGRAALAEWMGRVPDVRGGPWRVVPAPSRPLYDTDYPSVSIHTLASLDDLSSRMGAARMGAARTGAALDAHRFRGNLWVEGAGAWEEETWVGRVLAIGAARFEIIEPAERCAAPSANRDTGTRDCDIVGALRAARGAAHFGVYARVLTTGAIAAGDPVHLKEKTP